MKNIVETILFIFAIIGGLLLTACNDVLDQAPDGKTSLDEIFKDHFKTSAFLNSCYYRIPSYGNQFWYSTRGPACVSDEAWDCDDFDYPYGVSMPMYNGSVSASNYSLTEEVGFLNMKSGKYYERFFECIRNCATFIQRIDEATVNNETDRKRWKAEAHLLRAFFYMELLRWYGTGVPIVREPYEFDADFSDVEQPTYQQVIDFILEDCDFALGTPELPWRITSDGEAHRVTKALAEAIKSRATLYAASPLYKEGPDLWERAYQVNKTALKNLRDNGYELYNKVNFPDIYANNEDNPDNKAHLPNRTAALFNEYFTRDCDYIATPRDKETIYSGWDGIGDNYHSEGIGSQGTGKCGTVPVQEMVDSYETIDGEPVLSLEQPYLDEKHTQPNYNPRNKQYDENNPYANRDPRFYATIYYNGSKRTCFWNSNGENGIGNSTRTIYTHTDDPLNGIHPTSRTRTRTGYYLRKFISPNAGSDNYVAGPKEKFFRLGEIILNCAEAAAEAGHLQEAYDLVNEIRERASMPKLPEQLIADKQGLILRIRSERRVELAIENHRLFDVRRWQEPDGDLSATDKWVTAMEITRKDDTYTYERRPVRTQERLCYTNKYLKSPIPQREASRLYDLTGKNWQNPGW